MAYKRSRKRGSLQEILSVTWETIWMMGTISKIGNKGRLKIKWRDGHEFQMNVYLELEN